MLSERQIRMLELLDKQVFTCTSCNIHINGKAIPSWHPNSKFLLLGEAPGITEVRMKTPFVGAAGNILKDYLGKLGYKRSDFLIKGTK
jgi:uracil-DNA glycosylase family 4